MSACAFGELLAFAVVAVGLGVGACAFGKMHALQADCETCCLRCSQKQCRGRTGLFLIVGLRRFLSGRFLSGLFLSSLGLLRLRQGGEGRHFAARQVMF